MASTTSITVKLASVVAVGGGRFRVGFDYRYECWATAGLSVRSGDAAIVSCEPGPIAKGRGDGNGAVVISGCEKSLVELEFRLEIPNGGGLATDVRHAAVGGG